MTDKEYIELLEQTKNNLTHIITTEFEHVSPSFKDHADIESFRYQLKNMEKLTAALEIIEDIYFEEVDMSESKEDFHSHKAQVISLTKDEEK